MAPYLNSPQAEHVNTLKVPSKFNGLASNEALVLIPEDLEELDVYLAELFDENIVAKAWRTAVTGLVNNNPPTKYPEWVPQRDSGAGKYVLREADFWTCGFFPGLLYLCLERAVKFPRAFPAFSSSSVVKTELRDRLSAISRIWAEPIHEMARRTDTHDMAFMIQPSLRMDWELNGNKRSFDSVMTAAKSLFTRFNSNIGAVRSWDILDQQGVKITSMEDDFLVIIDSMCNLDLLFYASSHLEDPVLANGAIAHARTLLGTHLRKESNTNRLFCEGPSYSTRHVVNFSPVTGGVKQQMTAQGYSEASTWARGQAWGILGYAQTYMWTKEEQFLEAACGLAEYFVYRMQHSPSTVRRSYVSSSGKQSSCGQWVPLWDFDAPIEDIENPLRDSSAGIIAANGMLILSQALATNHKERSQRLFDAAIIIVKDTLEYSLATEKARFRHTPRDITDMAVEDLKQGQNFDAILKNATANHNSRDHKRYWDHGLVYGDYFLVEFSNRLLRMGLF